MYEAFYGFSGNPFRLNPDPSLFFKSKGHQRAYAYLKYGTYQREGFIVMTGEIGAGKTTLVRRLLGELDPNSVLAAHLVSTQLGADDLLHAIALAFGLSVEDTTKASLLATLEMFLRLLVRHERHALLIVDEAQNLAPCAMEELRMLSNFQIGIRPTLQSFLVGQPELRDLMQDDAMRQLRQRVIAACHLGPLGAEETRAYIEHRLRRVGWKGDPSFDPKVFELVHESSQGIPRCINCLCNRLLLGGYLSRSHNIGLGQVTQAIAELHEEVGVAPPRCTAPGSAPTNGHRNGGIAQAFMDSSNGDGAPPSMDPSIRARLDRLEKSVSRVQDLVQAMASTDGRV